MNTSRNQPTFLDPQQELLHLLERLALEQTLKLYSLAEAATALNVKERTIRHHIYKAKDLKYLLLGRQVRIRHQDLLDLVNRRLNACVHDQELLP